MGKVVIEVKDNKDNETCNVSIKIVGLDKATVTEKNTLATVYNVVNEQLSKLK